MEGNLPFLPCTLYLRAISEYKLPGGGLHLEGRFNGGFFALRVSGAYIWRGLFSEFYGICFCLRAGTKVIQYTVNIALKKEHDYTDDVFDFVNMLAVGQCYVMCCKPWLWIHCEIALVAGFVSVAEYNKNAINSTKHTYDRKWKESDKVGICSFVI